MAQWLRVLAALPDGPEFNSCHSHGGSQPSVTLVPGNLTLPGLLWALGPHGTQIHTQAEHLFT